MKHSIAIIPGDGIGQEIMPEALKVLAWAEKTHGIALELHHKDWAHCNYYLEHGTMMPDDWKPQLEACEAILFGAVGMPHLVPDHISLWGSLLRYRREFDQYVNLRPVKLLPGAPCPLANKQPGDIDFVVVRENTEGEYSAVGGRMFEGTDREIVLQESVFTRHGVDRVLKFAFEMAQSRPRKKLTAATKSNGIAISMPYWDERVDHMAKGYPEVTYDKQHVDILAARFVMQPERFDVVVAMDLLEHVVDPQKVIVQATRVLRPGGLFIYNTFNKNPLSWLMVVKGIPWFVKNTPEDYHLYSLFISPRKLETWMEEVGLDPMERKGIRPVFAQKSLFDLLMTREVPESFRFKFTKQCLIGYTGFAKKMREH